MLDFMQLHINQVRSHYHPFGRYYLLANHTVTSIPHLPQKQPTNHLNNSHSSRDAAHANSSKNASSLYVAGEVADGGSPSSDRLTPRAAAIQTPFKSSTGGTNSDSGKTNPPKRRFPKIGKLFSSMLFSIQILRKSTQQAPTEDHHKQPHQQPQKQQQSGEGAESALVSELLMYEDLSRHAGDDVRMDEDLTLWEQVLESFSTASTSTSSSMSGASIPPCTSSSSLMHVTTSTADAAVALTEHSSRPERDDQKPSLSSGPAVSPQPVPPQQAATMTTKRAIIKRKLLRTINARQGKKDILTLFAGTWPDFVFSILHDHSMRHTIAGLQVMRIRRRRQKHRALMRAEAQHKRDKALQQQQQQQQQPSSSPSPSPSLQ